MEAYQTLQTLNGHAVLMGILQCAAALAVVSFLVVKVFRSF